MWDDALASCGWGADLTVHKLLPALAGLLACALPAAAGVERPPQFIVMAFDNCTELERWQELTDFAAEMNKDGDKLHFTFFVSGINFIADVNRKIYEGPHQPRGASRINFGGTPADVARRVDYVNALHRSGHEIASHAVGHFNGASWAAGDWDKEFRSWSGLVENVGPNNQMPEAKLDIAPAQVVGFRAPYLAEGRGPLRSAQEQRLPLRHQRCRPFRRLAAEDRRHLALQSRRC